MFLFQSDAVQVFSFACQSDAISAPAKRGTHDSCQHVKPAGFAVVKQASGRILAPGWKGAKSHTRPPGCGWWKFIGLLLFFSPFLGKQEVAVNVKEVVWVALIIGAAGCVCDRGGSGQGSQEATMFQLQTS